MSKYKQKPLYKETGDDSIKWGRLYDIVTPKAGEGIPVGMKKIGVFSNKYTAEDYIRKIGKKPR